MFCPCKFGYLTYGKTTAHHVQRVQNHRPTHFSRKLQDIDCRIKVEYHKDIMTLVEEGMIIAVKNFKASRQSYTLLVISRIWPDHYGLKAISDHTYYPMN